MTPIFITAPELMIKSAVQFDLEMEPVGCGAWLINRACRPTWLSPISLFNLGPGHQRGDQSMIRISTALDRTQSVGDLQGLFGSVGLETVSSSISTPSFFA